MRWFENCDLALVELPYNRMIFNKSMSFSQSLVRQNLTEIAPRK